MALTRVKKSDFMKVLLEHIQETSVVVDIGPGIRPQKLFAPMIHICVEPYLPYIERLQDIHRENTRYVFLNCTWKEAAGLFPSRSCDTVFALDVIEHLSEQDGRELIQNALRIARRQVVVFTPLGFYPQSYSAEECTDRWGMQGGYWQTHRSGWLPENFGDEWDIIVCEEYHEVDQQGAPLECPWGAFWAIRTIASEPDTHVGSYERSSSLLTRITRKLLPIPGLHNDS